MAFFTRILLRRTRCALWRADPLFLVAEPDA
jgi:hypothetical protein